MKVIHFVILKQIKEMNACFMFKHDLLFHLSMQLGFVKYGNKQQKKHEKNFDFEIRKRIQK